MIPIKNGLRKIPVSTLFILFLVQASCVRDDFDFDRFSESISYTPSFVLPLAHGSLTLGNLLEPDDSLIFFDPDNSIRIAIREDSLFSVSAADVLEVPLPESTSNQFSMYPVVIDDFRSAARITLGDMTGPGRMYDPEASIINGLNGSTAIFPPVPDQHLGSFPADSLENIDHAYLTHGEMEMQVTNNLPVEVSMDIQVVNDYDGTVVGLFRFENLGPQQTESEYAMLAEVLVRKHMSMELINFSSPGSDGSEVLIDLEEDIVIEIFAENLLAEKGKAMVPVTVLDSGSDMLDMFFDPGMEIETLTLESGKINYSIDNDFGGLNLNIDLLNVTRDDEMFGFSLATDGSGGIINGGEDLSDACFDFSENDNKLMVGYNLVVGSEQEMTVFDLTGDMIGIDLNFSDFAAGYVSGYFGREELSLDDEEFEFDFDLFSKITGEFRFTNPSVRLFYENSLGVPVKLAFNLNGESSDGSRQAALFDTGEDEFLINTPEEPYNTVTGDFLINRETSNIVDFIALPPAKISLAASSVINPEGETAVPNFITGESSFSMGMEIELPLEMQLTSLGLTDTLEIDLDPDDIDIIERLIMTLEVTNGFPLGVEFDLILYDSRQDMNLHSFENIVLMEAAGVDDRGVVIPGSEAGSVAEIEITGVTVNHLRQADNFILSARLNTGSHNGLQVPVKLQTTNSLDFRIKARADINIKN